MTDSEALIILSSIPSMGPVRIKSAIAHFGSPKGAIEADKEELTALYGPKIAGSWNSWRTNPQVEKNFELIDRFRVKVIPYTSPDYPRALLALHDHPIVLYVCGELKPCDQRAIAIIGTRDCSLYGREMAEKFARELSEMGFTIISGLARGIDTHAHQGALRGGRTIGVIGSGLADLYPKENKQLAQQMVQRGALISEFSMNTPPDRQNFPQRNRIVSALSLGVFLVEAPRKSGAILTLERARQQDKKIFALPGRVDMESFQGNHEWIKQGRAALVENAVDIANQFDTLLALKTREIEPPPPIFLEPEEIELMKLLPTMEVQMETIAQQTRLPASKLNVLLMGLVLKGAVKEFPGKIYKKCV